MTLTGNSGIGRRTTGNVAPMSFAQELLWLLDRATPGLTAYNVPRALRIRGALNVPALEAAIDDVVERHEILRTTYSAGAEGAVQVINRAERRALPIEDRSAEAQGDRDAFVERAVLEEARTPFDLAKDRLLRTKLIRLADDDHVLVLASHHIAHDGWSKSVLFRDLSAAYAARTSNRPPEFEPLPVQYADFSAWQRDSMRDAEHDEHLAFWRERLSAPLPVLHLPTDMPRPATQAFEGARAQLVLPAALVAGVRELGMNHGATLYMVLLAAYQTVLHRYSGQDDILTGSPIAGRNQHETESLIGYFANTLAMRTSYAGDPTFAELLERISEYAIEAYEHEDVPFEKLVLDLRDAQETPSHAPLFRCVLTMEDTLPDRLTFGDAKVDAVLIDYGQAKFDLTMLAAEQPDGLRLTLWYRTDLFGERYATRFLGHVHSVLQGAVADEEVRVSHIALLTDAERRELAGWNDTGASVGSPASVVELFERQAARHGNRTAVVGGTSLSYGQLDARANQLARQLHAIGVQRGTPVGLLIDRSADAIVALLAVLKAGAAYMPLSVDAPVARLQVQMRESGASVIVTTDALLDRIPTGASVVSLERDRAALDAQSSERLDVQLTPDALCYVLYTSGSTGVPKGVAVTHANVVHYARGVAAVLAGGRTSPADALDALDGWHFGMASTLAADLGNTSLFGALLTGGTLHVLSRAATTEPESFAAYVREHPLDVLKITPNHYNALVGTRRGNELTDVMPAKWLVTGGEALRLDIARAFVNGTRGGVLNHYGPTEATVGALTFVVNTDSLAQAEKNFAQTVPLGRPLANTHAHVMSPSGEEMPVAIPGELWIAGPGVANGYLNRPELTAERFTEVNGERAYRTGDRVRRLEDGTIEFLGRGDDQVKVRGYRVELAEIEAALRQHPGIEHAAVLAHKDERGETSLRGYVVGKQAGYAVSHSDRPTAQKLVSHLSAHLPAYMIPGDIELLDAMPLTANGKIDRVALAALSNVKGASADEKVLPRTETEIKIAKIWSDVLKRDDIGVMDSFLDLGGHSLLAIRVLGRISKELGVRLPLRTLFESPTVEHIAQLVDAEKRQREADALASALASVEGMSDAEVAKLIGSDAEGGQ